MSDDYPMHCQRCGAGTLNMNHPVDGSRIELPGNYECGTTIRDPKALCGLDGGEGLACLQRQLDDAIAALEQAIPIVVAHNAHSSEGEHTLNLMRYVVDRHNVNLH